MSCKIILNLKKENDNPQSRGRQTKIYKKVLKAGLSMENICYQKTYEEVIHFDKDQWNENQEKESIKYKNVM